jgi:hypothetical protein
VRREEEPHKALFSNTPGSGVLVNRAIRTEGVISTVSASFLCLFFPLIYFFTEHSGVSAEEKDSERESLKEGK